MAKTTELELAIKIAGKVDPSLRAAISTAQKQVSTLSSMMGTIGRVGLAATVVGVAATAKAIASCTDEAEKFESQMAPVVRYVDGLADAAGNVSDAFAENGKTFKQNRDELANYIQDLTTQIPRSTEQITAMSAALGQSGIGVAEQMNTSILRDTAVAATAMDLDDQTAGNYMAKWQVAFTKKDENGNSVAYSHEDVMRLMDQINYLAANNATTAPELAQSVNQAASMGQIAGIDPAATAALATAMQATGVASDRTGTSITRMYTNLAKGESATKKQKEMFEELGLSAEGVAAGLQSDGVGTLKQVFHAINDMPDERKVAALSTLFGQWAIEGGAKIVNNMDVYEKALADVEDASKYSGSMEREFIINATTSESVDMMRENAKTALMQDIGEQFLPVKKQFSLLAIDVMNGLRKNMPQLTELATTLADIAKGGVEKLGSALEKAMPYIQQGLDYLNDNGEKVAKVIAGIVGGFAAMSIAPQAEMAVRGVGGAAKAGAGLFGNAVNFMAGNPAGGNGGRPQGIASALLGRITGAAANTGNAVTNTQNFVQAAGSTNGGAVGTAWALLKNKIMGGSAASLLGEAAQTPGLLNYMPTLRQTLASTPAAQAAGNAMNGVGNWVGGIWNNVRGFSGAQWQLAQGAGDGLTAGVNGIGNLINAAIGLPGAPTNGGQGTGAALLAAGRQMLGGFGGMVTNGAAGVAQAAAPFLNIFGGIAGAALPVVGVIGTIVAAVSLLKDNLDGVETVIGNVFGQKGVDVFEGFLKGIEGIKEKIAQAFSPSSLNTVRTNLVNLFGNEGVGVAFDNIVNIGKNVVGVFQQIADFGTQTVKPMFEQVFGWVSTTLLPGMLTAFNAIAPQIGPIISSIGTAVVNVATLIGSVIQALLPVIESIIMVALNVVATVGPPIMAAVAAIGESIANVVSAVQGVFDGLIQFITGVFTGNWSQAWEGVKQIFGNAFDALVELCKIPINAVIGLINGAINGINSIVGGGVTIPEWLGGGTFSLSLPTIPLLAKGGFTDGVSIAGEAGTEAVISFDPAYRSSNIANWQRAGQMLGVDAAQSAAVGGVEVKPVEFGNGSAPAGAAVTSGGSFTFAPNITIQGNADYDTVANALTDAKDMFEQWFEEMMRKQQRTAYAR